MIILNTNNEVTMNRAKRPMSRRMSKAMAKETSRQGSATIVSPEIAPLPLPMPRQASKKLPYGPEIVSKKAKGIKKVSKRTTPTAGLTNSPRAHVHPEGERWVHTLAKQNRADSKVFSKRLAKRAK
jgi:hypothetical protein